MSVLNFKPVLQEIAPLLKDQEFSTMYFGRHCGKNLLILKHHLTLLLVFDDNYKWSSPEFVKSVSSTGDLGTGIKIVGNENIILLLDKNGKLWKLINASESCVKKNKCLNSLGKDCFYKWVPFERLCFDKVLDITAFGCGFACIALCRNLERKLLVLPSVDSPLEDYTFEGLSTANSCSYYLKNLTLYNPTYKNTGEMLFVADRFTGIMYLCSKLGQKSVISKSDIYLVSVLHFDKEKCFVLCFENGKLSFNFYNESESHVMYLSKKLVCVEKCYCMDSCILWSDGVNLKYTKVVFQEGDIRIKLSHLALNCTIVCPLSFLNINQGILAVTINRIYYCASHGVGEAVKIQNQSQELSEIYNGPDKIGELQDKIYVLTSYLRYKEIQKNEAKADISLKGDELSIKSLSGEFLEDFWKVKLTTRLLDKNLVQMVDLDSRTRKGMVITIENPFKNKNKLKVSLVGDFDGNELVVDLGEVGTDAEGDSGTLQLSEQLKEILAKRNPCTKVRNGKQI